jgi:prepilin-type N-terminal cleavage/methylation domain-containing protein
MVRQQNRSVRSAFTLVEMIVVVGIVAVLMGLLLPALQVARQSGRQTVEMNAARQLMIAYVAYANVSRDKVLPGYYSQLVARDEAGDPIEFAPIRARYPWRIAPFLDYNFESLYVNDHADYLEESRYNDPFLYRYLVSVFPSLGLNTMWVGGDEQEGGFDSASAYGQFFVTSIAQVRRSDKLIVFASARGGDPSGTAGLERFEGYFRVLSPYGVADVGYRWADDYRSNMNPADYGYLSARHSGRTMVVSTMDAHIELMSPAQLTDMRRWADQADRADWSLTPGG